LKLFLFFRLGDDHFNGFDLKIDFTPNQIPVFVTLLVQMTS
jgi:hypothetical protein